MYIVVRNDLSDGSKIAQSCHVAFSFSQDFGNITRSWMENSNYICILECPEDQLLKLIDKAKAKNINYSLFKEPDLNDQITAIALEPSLNSKKLCSNFKLALRK